MLTCNPQTLHLPLHLISLSSKRPVWSISTVPETRSCESKQHRKWPPPVRASESRPPRGTPAVLLSWIPYTCPLAAAHGLRSGATVCVKFSCSRRLLFLFFASVTACLRFHSFRLEHLNLVVRVSGPHSLHFTSNTDFCTLSHV